MTTGRATAATAPKRALTVFGGAVAMGTITAADDRWTAADGGRRAPNGKWRPQAVDGGRWTAAANGR